MHNITHILIIHYHFKKGGVTDVVFRAYNALEKLCKNNKNAQFKNLSDIFFASGENFKFVQTHLQKNKSLLTHTIIIPSLGYCENESLYNQKEIISFFNKHTNKHTLWWVHNHHLGKNPFFTRDLLCHLKKHKQACILQIHDFPESARFKNLQLLQKTVSLPDAYNTGPNSVFAVINDADFTSLSKAGLQAILIPNIVPFHNNFQRSINTKSQTKKTKKTLLSLGSKTSLKQLKDFVLFTYPVRCIRRKNVLEAALIAALYAQYKKIATKFIVTLPGISDQENKYSNTIQDLYKNNYIDGFFGIGADKKLENVLSFSDVCRASDIIISSSVQEGFGFTYIGAASWKTPLLARTVEVTSDNKKALKFWPSHWYTDVNIPYAVLEKKEIQTIIHSYEQKIKEVYSYYLQMPFIKTDATNILQNLQNQLVLLQKKSNIDFSMLSVDVQVRLIKSCVTDVNLLNVLVDVNKNLLSHTHVLVTKKHSIKKSDLDRVKQNVDKHFSEAAFISAFSKGFTNSLIKPHSTMFSPSRVAQTMIKKYSHLSFLRLLLNPY